MPAGQAYFDFEKKSKKHALCALPLLLAGILTLSLKHWNNSFALIIRETVLRVQYP